MKTAVAAMFLPCSATASRRAGRRCRRSAGSARSASSVTRFGSVERHHARCRLVQVLVDALGERPADALHLGEVVDAAACTPRRPPKCSSSAWRRLAPMPGISFSIEVVRALPRRARWPSDGEAVRLVADLLDQVQAGMRRRRAAGVRASASMISSSSAGLALRAPWPRRPRTTWCRPEVGQRPRARR